ncbi:MAG TPA: RagB/SusD family nutrient uptake outer membrane protein, partial [Chitinophagaceae bacterium]|nr:RagB/SusD family nutrient uptake outer membrane protein [Chitinophagaceae bacterium]
MTSCKKMLDVELPRSLVSNETAFSDDAMATSATLGIYSGLMTSAGFAGGGSASITGLTGLSSDELSTYQSTVPNYLQLESNTLLPDNANVLSVWTTAYKSIYDANIVLEGLNNSTAVTKPVKDQLRGEALFVRAFCHFYLVNIFGDAPLIMTTDYRANTVATRTSKDAVYSQVEADLLEAEDLLSQNYITAGRLRVNKATAQAMLARVYLFRRNWTQADVYASKLIVNNTYQLETILSNVFLASSKEAIWQMTLPNSSTRSTNEGAYFIIEAAGDLNFNKIILKPGFTNLFESGDKRLLNWVKSFNTGSETVYFPYKYKLKFISASAPEHSTIFRLAEQYLIRAEARAHNDDLTGALDDIDKVRNRAGLTLLAITNPGISKDNLLLAIE